MGGLMVDIVVIRPSSESIRSVSSAAALMLFGVIIFLLLRNWDGGGISSRLGPGETTALAVGALLLGLYFVALWAGARRGGGELVRADVSGVVVQTVLLRKHYSPVAVDGFLVVRKQGRDLLAVTRGGKTIATTILQPDGMSWHDAAEQLNAWLETVKHG